jgi:hypothetical protein
MANQRETKINQYPSVSHAGSLFLDVQHSDFQLVKSAARDGNE